MEERWRLVADSVALAARCLLFTAIVRALYIWSQGEGFFPQALTLHIVVGLGAAFLFRENWDASWHAGIGDRIPGTAIAGVPIAAAVFGVIEAAIGDSATGLLAIVGATSEALKWSLIIVTFCLLSAMVMSLFTLAARPELRDSDGRPTVAPDQKPERRTVGISCSGGGIRSAAYTLGGLSALERVELPADIAHTRPNPAGLLGNADFLSSVSGGGYAAAAWRTAAGTDTDPPAHVPRIGVLGTPDQADGRGEDGKPSGLIAYIKQRRRYLANGRGGLPGAFLKILLLGTWHFALLLLLVAVLAWPAGWINERWTRSMGGDMAAPLGIDLDSWPSVVVALLAIVPFAIRVGMHEGKRRDRVDLFAKAGAGLFVLVFGGTVIAPWLAEQTARVVADRTMPVVGAGIWATVVTAIWQFGRRLVRPYVKALGGVLLALGLFGLGLVVMSQRTEVASTRPFDLAWLVGLAVLFVGFAYMNPDSWSLNRFYRERLTKTFAAHMDPDGTFRPCGADEALGLDDYVHAWGPQPIVCCAAAREATSATGLSVVSLIAEPGGLTVFRWDGDTCTPAMLTPPALRARLPRSIRGKQAFSLMGAAAISGAAVAPSLGRLSVGTTNALFAAFNARLGMWLPNPSTTDHTKKTTPRLVNMFKEIQAVYDDKDPNLYASDGGHWENLGLVELLRKRCDVIISFDASRDAPGSLQRLQEALDLAKIELNLDISAAAVHRAMEPAEFSSLPKTNFGVINFHYPATDESDPAPGRIVFIKAAVAAYSSVELRRFAATDPNFPNFSTGDQLLQEEQFSQLVRLGYESTTRALNTHGDEIWDVLAGVKTMEPVAGELLELEASRDQSTIG